ncbi:MAG: hypothetical protein PHW02_03370 [bacterium]|nr:hypothetical protein [bacterium]
MNKNLFPLQLIENFSDSPLFGKRFSDWFSGDSLSLGNAWEIVPAMERMILGFAFKAKDSLVEFDSPDLKIIGDKRKIIALVKPEIEGTAIINTSKGPVIFGENVTLRNFTSIEGPCYIGSKSTIDSATLRGPLICGRECKLSGEIEESYMMDYVNKHHYGFIGHSVIGSWVNLGAGTTNSDLKNNYSNVRMFDGEEYRDTMMIKAGCIIGEHVKTSIGTMINTGTVIGPFSNVFEDIRDLKYVKPFSWGGHDKVYEFDKLTENIQRVMKRRSVECSAEYLEKVKVAYSDFSV